MRLKTDTLALVVLVGCFIVLWRDTTDRDVAVAQGRKTVVVTRIFTGPDGFGPEDRIALTIPLADGVVIEGTRTPRTR